VEQKIIMTVLLAIFLVAAIAPRIIQKRKKIETVGCIGIHRALFFTGKAALFASFALVPVQAYAGDLSLFGKGDAYFWASSSLIGLGVAFFSLAILKLGTFSLRVGITKEKTILRDTGIYRVSRNPMLVGLFLIAIGSAVYVRNPLNWLLVGYAFFIHYKIIIAEEASMLERFGQEWIGYAKRVRRFL
jgi:protein-S-isoprenylcysteine O-methyltransferase Ste14